MGFKNNLRNKSFDSLRMTGVVFLFFLAFFSCNLYSADPAQNPQAVAADLVINDIILTRNNPNKFLTDDAILNRVPYQKGIIFDPRRSSQLIHNLYGMSAPYGFFEQIYVAQENLADNRVNVHIITYEKPELEDIIIVGNKALKDDDLDEKLNLGDIQAINEVDLQRIVKALRKGYSDKNFHLIEVEPEIFKHGNKASVVITVKEGIKSFVKRVRFKGNEYIRSKDIRKVIFTREDWLLGALNKAGNYDPERLEIDKHIIESFYKTKGFLLAKVIDVDVVMDPITKQYDVTFTIKEGDCYRVGEIHAHGNDIIPEEILLKNLPLRTGEVYSSKDMQESIEKLKEIWGIYGYVFADIDPIMIPNEQDKTVNITFNSELGDKVYVNRINIIGNKKTRDKVIRRKVILNEGDLVTGPGMELSKARVEGLGYFDPREGVNWKINRVDKDQADLDLIVKEVKTGKFFYEMGFGGSNFNIYSAARSLKISGNISDTNLFGSGIIVRGNASWSRQEWSVSGNIANPYFADENILMEADVHVTQANYEDELHDVTDFTERIIGGFLGSGFTIARTFLRDTAASLRIGVEDITHSSKPRVETTQTGSALLQAILDRRFQDGIMAYSAGGLAQDFRNHTVHPSNGYQWALTSRMGVGEDQVSTKKDGTIDIIPGLGYIKCDLDAVWYSPLIGEQDLIFAIHAHAGFTGSVRGRSIPYRDLYHIGGPASVRGFLPGQIGPTLLGNSIGAKKAFWVNTEIIFPITEDMSMKADVFYDGGAGWDTPLPSDFTAEKKLIKNNKFNFRHSVGFGFRMTAPQPMKIDIGFKLDKQKGEKAVEVHFSGYREF